ncbi:transmembrane channel-like protein 3 [Ostrinia nubilalis]|uniref:transmembrane channel-like protein 3 n=1 Tax=Ostrinia nubilalis TaxID=29057 RepID=UPI0030826123
MENEEEIERPPSARRTFTLRHGAARQVAINFMPSRQLSYNTLRLRRTNSEHNALLEDVCDAPAGPSADKRADMIVRELEQHQRLMDDNPEAEELRREALRDLPQGLTMKRHVRAKLSASVSLRSKRRPISMTKRLKYRMGFTVKRFRERLRDFTFSIEPWYEAIRNIEGHFGSAVGSYFYFLRWLFVLDVLLAVFVVGFVVVPQALYDSGANSTGVQWSFLDFISGKGSFEDSLLFYGHYHSGDISAGSPLTYSMPFAYFFTMVCLYLVVFAVLCYRTAYSYRRNFIETAGGVPHALANKLFCGWDFGVVTRQAAALNATSIYNELKELLSEQNKNKESASLCTRIGRNLANVIVTTLVIGSIIALEYGLWMLLSAEVKIQNWEVIISVIITAGVALCPLLFNMIVRLEFYEPRTAVYVTLARTWLLDVGTLMLLLGYWSRSDEPVSYLTSSVNLTNECWETTFGQEVYRLVLLDAIVSLFVLPVVEGLRALFYHKFNPNGKAPEFNIAYNSLTVIYNQAALWFGALFAPLLVVAVALKLLCLFYVKRICALRACQPARKVWRAAQTQTVFYMLVTLSLFTTLFGIGSLFFWKSSQECGPFRSYAFVYEVVSEGVLRLSERPTTRRVLAFITRPGAVAFLMLALCVCVYYVRARARAQRSMVRLLRQMLVLQAKDKEFLLHAITKVSNGEWLYSPKSPTEGPDSHTWKYLNEVRKPSNAGYQLDASRLSHSFPDRPRSQAPRDDGDTDSSFSWQGSSNCLHQGEAAGNKWL